MGSLSFVVFTALLIHDAEHLFQTPPLTICMSLEEMAPFTPVPFSFFQLGYLFLQVVEVSYIF